MCLFCEIVQGEKPCYKVYENEHVTAFLDIFPTAAGHTLVVPKTHIERLDQLKDSHVATALMQGLVEVPKKLMQAGICTDFTVFSDNGKQAEQDIHHLHFHVIPRVEEENFHIASPVHSKSSTQEALAGVWKKLQ
ncbi:MAG TPA: HIT domain-containing protein [Bacillota bacterium]|nr:HIT domain-containing protein [Bacillota bacterium]